MARTKQTARHSGYSPSVWGLYHYPRGTVNAVCLPLLNVAVEARIKELAAQVKLTHTYGNDADLGIEAVYSFPIPARAAVSSFVMVKQDGTKVVGKVEEISEARQSYEDAIADGKHAALMEYQTPDVFKMAVGNIPPLEQVKIELVYATVLSEDEENDSVRLLLPMHIGARYGQPPPSLTSSSTSHHFSSGQDVPFLKISASVETSAPIAKISSPSHPVATELGPHPNLPNANDLPFANYARVSLASEAALEKDFVLTVKSAGLDAPRCIAELHPVHPTVALALTLVPRFKLPDIGKQEFIFLVDRSGSMGGARIAAARKALVVMLRSLPAQGSSFQIMSFGDECTALWEDGSRAYNQSTVDDATQHVDDIQADYGGTEICEALEMCFQSRKTDQPTSVFVLTDGEAWDLEGVFQAVKNAVNAAPAQSYLRVFVLGIGDSASTAMVEGIARVGNGTCMMVGDQEASFTGKIARLLKAARAPLITNIGVDWGIAIDANDVPQQSSAEDDDVFVMVDSEGSGDTAGPEEDKGEGKQKTLHIFDEAVDPMQLDAESVPPPPPVVLGPLPQVQQSPCKIQNLSPGNRLNMYAILQGKNVPKQVTLTGSTQDGSQISLTVPVTLSELPNEPDAPPAVHALAARTLIQDLEDGQHGLAIEDADLLERTVQASIVRLGKAFSIASSATSFVAVDESPAGSRARHPDIIKPSAATVTARNLYAGDRSKDNRRAGPGYGKAPRKQLASKAARKTAASLPVATTAAKTRSSTRVTATSYTGGLKRKSMKSDSGDQGQGQFGNAGHRGNIDDLARHQSFDGCFSRNVLSVIQLNVDETTARAALLDGISDEIFATILAMVFMSCKLGPAERESWEAMYDKARVYVESNVQVSVDELETKAAALLV
ncbi:von Willebrand factor type A domain-containing protein [Favolaschia claudopus]|uniref:von Willebrand factor type A domain-containing protein n=1 Tax=Favolaschia claudopus TaxID=2862362 RepID=A0AAW0BSG1_9AGAR